MRLSDKFNIKTKTVIKHQHDITHYMKCPEKNCNENYVGGNRLQTVRKTVIDHTDLDKNSDIFRHSVEKKHKGPSLEFTIFGDNFRKNKFHRKVAELVTQKRNDQHLTLGLLFR